MAGETVLVIKDEASIRTVVRAYLDQAGYRVVLAETGPPGLGDGRRADSRQRRPWAGQHLRPEPAAGRTPRLTAPPCGR
jgi:hypothetical protein